MKNLSQGTDDGDGHLDPDNETSNLGHSDPGHVGPGTKEPLTKTVGAMFSKAEEMYPTGWGCEEGFGPQSERAAKRRQMSPRMVPIGRGRCFSKGS